MTPNVAENFEALPVKDLTGAHEPVPVAGKTGVPVPCATPDQLETVSGLAAVGAAPFHDA